MRDFTELGLQHKELERGLQVARREHQEMVDRLARADLESGVSRGAMVEPQGNLGSLQLELGALKEVVAYYRALFSAKSLELEL